MGCLRLTYSAETTVPNWQVWVSGKGAKQHKDCGAHWSDQYMGYTSTAAMIRDALNSTPSNGWSYSTYDNGVQTGFASGTFSEEGGFVNSRGRTVRVFNPRGGRESKKHPGHFHGAYVYGFEAMSYVARQGGTLEWAQSGGKVDLSGSPDDVFNGLVNQFDRLFEGPFLRRPNDGGKKNFFNINDIVTNPPEYSTGSVTGRLSSPDLYTKSGVKFRWSISPYNFNESTQYSKGYLVNLQSDDYGHFANIHLLGVDNHSVLTLKIYGRENFVPIVNQIYKGYKKWK